MAPLNWLKRFLICTACMVVWVPASATGNALNFDGINDFVSMPIPPALNPTSNFSVTVWVRPTALGITRVFFAQASAANFISMLSAADGRVLAYVVRGGTTFSLSSTNLLTTGAWNHVVMSWDAAGSALRLYINGVAQPVVGGGTSTTGANGVLTIGSRTDGAQVFNGAIDRLDIFSRVLTAAEVSTSGLACPVTGASHSYAFDQGVAGGVNAGVTTLPDGIGGINGTLQNFALAGAASNWVTSGVVACALGAGVATASGVPVGGPVGSAVLAMLLAVLGAWAVRRPRQA